MHHDGTMNFGAKAGKEIDSTIYNQIWAHDFHKWQPK